MVGGLSIEGCLSAVALCNGGIHRRKVDFPKAYVFIPERDRIVNNRRRAEGRIAGRQAWRESSFATAPEIDRDPPKGSCDSANQPTMETSGLNLLIPDKPDAERDALAASFVRHGGMIHLPTSSITFFFIRYH
jgi:hypothetical protein